MKHIRIILLLFFAAVPVFSETIVLKDGSTFETNGYWEENRTIYFMKYGQPIGIPKKDVLRIEGEETPVQETTSYDSEPQIENEDITAESIDAEYQALAKDMAKLYQKKAALNEFEWDQENRSLKKRAGRLARKTATYYDQTSSRE